MLLGVSIYLVADLLIYLVYSLLFGFGVMVNERFIIEVVLCIIIWTKIIKGGKPGSRVAYIDKKGENNEEM